MFYSSKNITIIVPMHKKYLAKRLEDAI